MWSINNNIMMSISCLDFIVYSDFFQDARCGPSDEDRVDLPRKVVHKVLSPRWEVAVITPPGSNKQLHKVRMVWTYISNCGLLVMSE